MIEEGVSDVIAARASEPEGLTGMVAVSVAVHVVVVTMLILAPAPSFEDDAPKTVMTISLGGAAGPRTGMTPMGGQAVQTTRPLESSPVRAPVAPAPKAPEMTLPRADARPLRSTPSKPEVAPKEATSRTPTVGDEVREGSTRTDTGVRGQGFGLSGGGGGGTGSGAYVDVGNFCCPEYLETVVQSIQRNWMSKQSVTGATLMKFTIDRNGTVRDMQVERPSGFMALDMAAQRALFVTGRVPPLPAAFTNPTLTVHLRFEYQR